ncbi:C2H2-type zinc finger protein [Thermoproteota archaeon]
MAQEEKILGVVNAVGIERDDQEFRNFTLILGIKIKTDKKITYTEGEKIIKQLQKNLLGKNIELETIAVPCPICGKTYNSEQGMKQHQRLQHGDEEPSKKKPTKKKKTTTKKKKRSKKKTRSKK